MSTRTDGPRNVPALLTTLYDEGHSGTVVISGAPGGKIHLRDGRIVAVETPGAPGVESLLLASGRVDDASWRSACAADSGTEGGVGAELQARGLLAPEEFEIVCTAAVFDGAFALALSPPGDWEVTEPIPTAVIGPAFEPHLLAAETSRRLLLLSRLWGPPAEFARTRVRPDADRPASVPSRYAALLEAANGRRTPRDIAFALGRGTYAVMLDLARMAELGLLHREKPAAAGRPSTAPRRPTSPAHHVPSPTDRPLPRRSPGTHHPHRTDSA
ncbi:MarR family transcriptional regulator [Streptomyces sp. NPDC058451]|uniref:MarR family transcriptional regulator n=1 Tax=Streptomyces sp. NPDC058451 TaxID=3346506 RepID=UPI0036540A87